VRRVRFAPSYFLTFAVAALLSAAVTAALWLLRRTA